MSETCNRRLAGIALVWVGPWSPWIQLTLYSFARSKCFALHVISPEAPPGDFGENVHFHRISVSEISARVSQIVGTSFHLNRPYKLCDFKPLFSRLFPEILDAYPFWGWCDEDIIWGDLDRFFLEELLKENDIVTSCRCSITGQFALVRHSETTDNLFRFIPEWRSRLIDQGSSYALDEIPLNEAALALEKETKLRVCRRQFQTHDVNSPEWNEWADRLELAESNQPHGEFKHGPAIWRDGRIFNEKSGEEYAFFHFGTWKRRWRLPTIPLPPPELAEWRIDEEGISFPIRGTSSRRARQFLRLYRHCCNWARIRAAARGVQTRAFAFVHRIQRSVKRRLAAGHASI